jgi:carbon monoxide dehydrogenase subunit G
MNSYTRAAALLALPLCLLKADFSYDQTSRITGGMMVSMMKVAGAFSKDAKKAGEPTVSTIAVKGNRMVHRGADTAQIIDLDAETITRINFEAKTYSVITFAQMKQALDDAAKKMQERQKGSQADMQFEVSLKDTGAKKMIAGLDTHEVVMSLKMKSSDEKSGTKGSMDMVTDMWLAPKVPGYDEVRAFYKTMGEKLNWTPGGNPMMASRPDMSKAMAEMYKEGSKMDGMPVYEVVNMGGTAEGIQQNPNTGQAAPTQSSTQAAPAQSSDSQPTSVGGALGGALAGRFGLGRKKKPQTDDSQQSTGTQAQPSGGSQSASGSASLMEMTIEMSNFSSSSVDGAKLEVPAGFSKVEEDALPQHGRRSK